MANHRRSKPSVRTRKNVHSMNSWPRWWDVLYHRRPARRAAHRLEHEIVRDMRDADDTAWPDAPRKPHNYYW